MRDLNTSPVRGYDHQHPPGGLILMSCLVQRKVTLKPTVVPKPEQGLCQMQELSLSVTARQLCSLAVS